MNDIAENGKNFSQKNKKIVITIVSAVLAVAIIALAVFFALRRPKDYDFSKIDLSDNVSLSLPNKTRSDFEEDYKKAFLENEIKDIFYPDAGGKIDFYLTSYIYENGEYKRYEEFCRDESGNPVKDYMIRESSDNLTFDTCLMYDIASNNSGIASLRKCVMNSSFGFEIEFPDDAENENVAGKKFKFVIVPIAYKAPVVLTVEVHNKLYDIFSECEYSKEKAEYGDAVFLSVIAREGSQVVYSNTSSVAILGNEHLFYGFDKLIDGMSAGVTATFNIEFKNDVFSEDQIFYDFNGKKIDFYITVNKICDTEKFISEKKGFSDVYALIENSRFEYYVSGMIANELLSSSKINSYPSGSYKWMEKLSSDFVEDIIKESRKYMEKLMGEKVSEESALRYAETNYLEYTEYIEKDELIKKITEDNLNYIIIINAAAKELSIDYSEDDYKNDALLYTENIKDLEDVYIGGKQYLRASFILNDIIEKLSSDALSK